MRHQIEHVAVSSIALMVRALPLSVVRRLGEGLGLMFYLVDAVHRRIALANLEVAFPKKSADECRIIARAMFQHFGRLLLELLKYASLSRERQMALVDWEGEERVAARAGTGKGILFCTGHFGFWEKQALAHALKFEPWASWRARSTIRSCTICSRRFARPTATRWCIAAARSEGRCGCLPKARGSVS